MKFYNHCNRNIVDICGTLFTLNLSVFILNSQFEDGARDLNNIWVTVVTTLVWDQHEFRNKNHILGHEEMHAKMVLVMFGTLFAGQILLFMWRKKHPRSYNLGMFSLISPPIISFIGPVGPFSGFWLVERMITLKSYTHWHVIYSDMLFYLFWILSFYFHLGHLFTYYWNCLSKSKFQRPLEPVTTVRDVNRFLGV